MRDKSMSKIIKPGDRAFYINRNRYVESESSLSVGVEGFYIGKAIKPGFGVVREFGQRVPSPNLITNLGLDALGEDASFIRMHLGTGTAPPQDTDTGLDNFGVNVQGSNPVQSFHSSGESPWFCETRLTWTSAVGGATGTWTEIGVSNQNTNGNLRSRALILDQGGQPTSFPVLADEQFQGTYIFREYVPESDSPATITLGSNSYNTITRPISVATVNANPGQWGCNLDGTSQFISHTGSQWYTGGLVAITAGAPTGPVSGAVTASASAYGAGNYYRDSSLRWGSGSAVGSLRTLVFAFRSGRLQVEYDPVVNKLTTEEVIHNQRISWARR